MSELQDRRAQRLERIARERGYFASVRYISSLGEYIATVNGYNFRVYNQIQFTQTLDQIQQDTAPTLSLLERFELKAQEAMQS